ncbi:hypothetical protein NDU88_004599 [Pleurodeles waltl]|uniref:Uncharacterized protein n=1 Tax=Pleurodeles waltl TaxID=8319 RepID=A0AAV7UH83_PLEWA|nr:hypothetical protein NDU88_004599 [Pleurodeles waltl]
MPTHPAWQPLPWHPERTQAKRKMVNEGASRTVYAAWWDVRIGDRVVVKDRRPGWKFRTPYEPGVWIVTRVAGTMVTAVKRGEKVTWNVFWFSRLRLKIQLKACQMMTTPQSGW